MLMRKFLKTFFLMNFFASLVIQPLRPERGLSSGIVMPGAPVGFQKKITRLTACTALGCLVGFGVSRAHASSDREVFLPLGAVAGFLVGVATWNVGSARDRLNLFNLLYTGFLLNPMLEKDLKLENLINRSVISSVQSYWALVRVVDLLDEVIKDLVEVITFGQILRESKLIQNLGDNDFESLVSKISSLQTLLERARERRNGVINHPSYALQKQFYARYGSLKNQKKLPAEAFDLAWNDWCLERLNNKNSLAANQPLQLFSEASSDCSLCGLMILQNKRYATRCGCVPGKHFYHHECVTRALRHNKNECLKCGYPAIVRSAFSTTEVAGPLDQNESLVSQNAYYSGAPTRSRCALCRGIILRSKAYKTACLCPEDSYFYHHDCLKTHLSRFHDCPKCKAHNPAVHSDLNDGFSVETNKELYSGPVLQNDKIALDQEKVLNTCALCDGKITDNKRYKTRCACLNGRYYYHHLCISDTLKKNGNRCPKCLQDNATVHSAF